MMEFLVPEFNISEELQVLLKSASPATIDHKPKKGKERYRVKAYIPPSRAAS